MAIQAPPRLTDLVLDFLGHLELERGLSRNTLEAYRSDLQQYGAFLDRRGLSALEITPVELSEFVSELARGGPGRPPCAPATLQRKIACLRSFYRHLRREQMIDHDPASRAARAQDALAPSRGAEQGRGDGAAGPAAGTEPGALRDRALLETMYACGLRASEATGLELSDLDLEAGVLRARGKGSKERLVPIGARPSRVCVPT